MFTVPHRLIEGCLITAHAIESRPRLHLHPRRVPARVRDPARRARRGAQGEAARRRHDRAPPRRRRLHLRRGDGAARVARGQARPAADEAAVPGRRRPLRLAEPDQQRRDDRDRAEDRRARRQEYAKIGVPPDSSGTRVFSLSGNVVNGGNYELPMGVTLRELIYDALGGGIPNGRQLKAVIPGGSSVPVLTADQLDTPLDANSMAEAGSMLGSGAIIVIDDRCCMVQLGLRVAQFYMHESCGKCTPCREGTRWMVQILRDRGGDGVARATSTCCSTSATGSSASASARSATPPRCRSRATSTSSAPSSRSTSTAAARCTASRPRSRASSPRSTSTPPVAESLIHVRFGHDGQAEVSTHERARASTDVRVNGRRSSTAARSRSRRAPGSSRRPPPPGSRSRSSATSRGSARPSAPAGCASSRSRACRSSRPAAR